MYISRYLKISTLLAFLMSQNWSQNHIACKIPSNFWETHILVIKNGQFGGKYIFKTDYFDM